MRRTTAILFLSVAAVFGQGTGAVEGKVTSSATGAGVAGVAVSFFTPQGDLYKTATDAAGTFRISGMKEGTYRYQFEREGFEANRVHESPLEDRSVRVAVGDPARVFVQMTPWAAISGRVVDQDGNPLANMQVELQGASGPFAIRYPQRTAADGSFQFDKVLPGNLKVMARPEEEAPASGASPRYTMVPTYFPSSTNPNEALAIPVRGGANETGVEIRMRLEPLYRVRGVVLDEDGKPAPEVTLSFIRKDGPTANGGISTIGNQQFYVPLLMQEPDDRGARTDKNGEFEYWAREGDWTLIAERSHYDEVAHRERARAARGSAFVSGRDAAPVELRLASAFEYSATVDWGSDENRPQDWRMMLMLFSPVGKFGMGTTKEDGKARFEGTYPGRYYPMPIAPLSDYYASSVLLGGQDVMGRPVDLTPSSPPMRVVFRKRAGSVRGTVVKDQPASIVLMPVPNGTIDYVRSTEYAAGGSFQMTGLRPGEYYVAAFDRLEPTRLSDPNFLSTLYPLASRIKVEEGSSISLDLPVNRWPQ